MKIFKFTQNLAETRARQVIRIGFSLVMLIIVFIIIFGLNRLSTAHESLIEILNNEQAATEMLFNMQRISHDRSVALYRIASTTDSFERDSQIQYYENLGTQFGQARHKLSELMLDATEHTLLAQQKQDALIAMDIQNKMIDLALQSQLQSAQGVLNKQAIPAQDKVLASINGLLDHKVMKAHEDVLTIKQRQWQVRVMMAAGGFLAILLVWLVFRFVKQRMGMLIADIAATTQEIKEINQHLEMMQQAVDKHNIVSITDVLGNITYVNDLFCQISQYSQTELIGKNHRLLKSGLQPDEVFDDLWHTISSGKIWQGEVCNRNKQGGYYWVATTIVPMLDDHGLPSQYISIRTEITAIKAAQQVLLRSKAELETLVQERTAELQERKEVLHSITNAAQDAVIMTDHSGNVTYWNPAAEKMFGYAENEILGHNLHSMVAPAYQAAFPRLVQTGAGALIGETAEVQALRRDGTAFSAEISISSVKLKNNWHAVAILRDISARKLVEAQLIKLATTDALTGICNRRRFNEVIGAEISRASRYHKELGLLIFDIDHFKHINDQFGHQAGDQVLIQLSSLVAKSLRDTDVFARWGGEEFTVLVPSCGDACALRLAEKLRAIIENAEFPDVGKVTCSFGMTTYHDQDNEEAILKRADDALYRAKAAGRNRVEFG